MRVGIVAPEYAGVTDYTGGIGTHFRAIAEGLSLAGDDVKVLLLAEATHPATEAPELRSVGVGPLPRPKALRPVALAKHSAKHGAWLSDCDVVLAAEWAGLASLFPPSPQFPPLVTNLATSLSQVRAIEPPPRSAMSLKARDAVQMRLEARQIKRSDSLVAISDALLEWTARQIDLAGKPATVIPNFLSDGEVERLGSLHRRPEPGTVVFTGRLSGWKGADVLTKALRQCWDSGLDLRITFLGTVTEIGGKPADQVIADIAGPFASRVDVRGHVSREEIQRELSRAEIAVFPSLFEGFGMGALEALAAGVPTVVTSGSGFSTFCSHGDNSLMVPPGDADRLAEALRRLHGDSGLREHLAVRSRATARDYTQTAVIQSLRSELIRASATRLRALTRIERCGAVEPQRPPNDFAKLSVAMRVVKPFARPHCISSPRTVLVFRGFDSRASKFNGIGTDGGEIGSGVNPFRADRS